MGNWNWQHRRRYRFNGKSSANSRYEELPPPIPQPGWQDNVPSWEKQFCSTVGSVPWWKVVDAKKLMYCHSNVANWNDSAGEEAFHNAKQRFWAEINGLPCDICLPNPDIYIDEIDWNPYIDPELILDLDRAYVSLDEAGIGTHSITDVFSGLQSHHMESSEPSKVKATGWGEWDESKDAAYNNPWEQSYTQDSGALKDLAWRGIPDLSGVWKQVENSGNDPNNLDSANNFTVGSGAMKNNPWNDSQDKSWCWNHGENYDNRSRDLGTVINPWEPTGENPLRCSYTQTKTTDEVGWGAWGRSKVGNSTHQSNRLDNVNSPLEHGFQCSGSVKDKRWSDIPYDSRGSKDWKNSTNRSRNLYDNRQWGCGAVANNPAGKDSRWKNSGENSWRCKHWESNYNNGPKNLESRAGNGSWETWNGGCRKREGSFHHTPRYNKNSRFLADDRQVNNKRGQNQKRVSFV